MRVTGERKRALYHSATADVRESAKKNDDGSDGARKVARRARDDDDALVSLSLICVNRVIRLPSTARTSA
jgi:hypothetical protein